MKFLCVHHLCSSCVKFKATRGSSLADWALKTFFYATNSAKWKTHLRLSICNKHYIKKRPSKSTTYLLPASWPWACYALTWPPCSSAGVSSDSIERTCNFEPRPGTCPLNSCPVRRPRFDHRSPALAGAPGRGWSGQRKPWNTPEKRSGCQHSL